MNDVIWPFTTSPFRVNFGRSSELLHLCPATEMVKRFDDTIPRLGGGFLFPFGEHVKISCSTNTSHAKLKIQMPPIVGKAFRQFNSPCKTMEKGQTLTHVRVRWVG